MNNKRILIVDDDPSIRKAIKLTLMDGNHEFYEAFSVDKAQQIIRDNEIDIALIDVRLGDEYGPDIIKFIKKENYSTASICISGEASATEAVEAVKHGAFEFLEKPITPDKLRTTLENCIRYYSLSRTVSIQQEVAQKFKILGNSEPIQQMQKLIDQFAPSHSKVLITGETGTGKELVASQIHYKSERADAPFIIVNCSAIPGNLIESTFFGHKKGSFTGADSDQIGKLEYADGGTIFLDEIGDLTIEVQNKLLRFLETGEIQKLGSNQNKVVDVRVIAATSKPLEEMIQEGAFRQDLYYRLNVLQIKTPSLKSIPDDLPLLFEYFISRFSIEQRRTELEISPEFKTSLISYSWPGNMRELRNFAERCVIMKTGILNKDDFSEVLGIDAKSTTGTGDHSIDNIIRLNDYMDICEKKYLEQVLTKLDGNVTQAANQLDIQRATLHNKIKKHRINTKD